MSEPRFVCPPAPTFGPAMPTVSKDAPPMLARRVSELDDEVKRLSKQNDRYEKALREIVEYMGPRCTGNSAADARDMCCIAEAALTGSAAK